MANFCADCGAELTGSKKFCTQCGVKVGEAPSAPIDQGPPTELPREAQAASAPNSSPVDSPNRADAESLVLDTGSSLGRIYLEYTDGSSAKFWEAWIEGTTTHVHYGRIGAQGQTTIHEFPTLEAAENAVERKHQEKLRKGYLPA